MLEVTRRSSLGVAALLGATLLAGMPAAPAAEVAGTPAPHATSPAPAAPAAPVEPLVVEESVTAAEAALQQDFDLAAVRLEDGSDLDAVQVRVQGAEGWSSWTALEVLGEDDGPDPGTEEYARARAARATVTEPILAAGSTAIELRMPAGVEATLVLIDGGASGDPAPATTSTPSTTSSVTAEPDDDAPLTSPLAPALQRRADWGADESLRTCVPEALSGYRGAVVHHTVNSNSYTPEQSADLVRSIYAYHTQGLGWCDVGYQFLVDRFGTVYEGRHGSADGAVLGAQSGGFNRETFGVAVIGDFMAEAPTPESLAAVTSVIHWQFARGGIDPTGHATFTSSGNSKHPAGSTVTLPTVMGHRDNGHTLCPGDEFYALLDVIRLAIPSDPPCSTDEPTFSDVPTTHSFFQEVCWLSGQGVTTGYTDGTFRPTDPIQRGAMAAFLFRYAGETEFVPPATSPFTDLTPESSFYREITWLAQTGVTTGYRDGTFRSTDPIDRGSMAAFLFRYAGSPEFTAPETSRFTDLAPTSSFFREIHWLEGTGITLGYADGTFRPGEPVQRGAMAAFLFRANNYGIRHIG